MVTLPAPTASVAFPSTAPVAEPVMAATPPLVPAAINFTVPLTSMSELDSLAGRPEIDAILEATRRYPTSQIYVVAYATEEDARKRGTDPKSLSDQMILEMGRTLANRGIAPDRISGKGMGMDPAIGRALVVSLDVTAPPAGTQPSARQLAEREAAQAAPDRYPRQNVSFKEVGGTTAYRVGPGDQIRILHYLVTSTQDQTVTVSPSGTITFDLADSVPVMGLTVDEIQNLLVNVLKRYYRNPRLSVEVKGYGGRTITLIGPNGAQSVTLSGRMTLLDLIAKEKVPFSGSLPGQGIVGSPDLKAVRVVRGKQEFAVNLFRIVLDRDWQENLVLDDGDIVYLPTFSETGNYTIVLGAVTNPGVYPMARALTAVQALYAAGGPIRGAYLPHARIIRGSLQRPEIIPADIDLVVQKGDFAANKTLQSGDVLFVPRTRIANCNEFLADISPTVNLATLPLGGAIGARILFGTGETKTVVISPTPIPLPLPAP